MYSIEGCKSKIKELRKTQVAIQNRIQKQEDNDVFDESLYDQLDAIDKDIAYYEKQLECLELEN